MSFLLPSSCLSFPQETDVLLRQMMGGGVGGGGGQL